MVTSLFAAALATQKQDFMISADLSFLRQAEQHGTVFKDAGVAKPGLQIFKDHGYNWIRLRIFVNPTALPNNLEYTIAEAKEAKKLGFKFHLDFHYSDTWADPGKQFIPKAWQGKTHKEVAQLVFEYSRDTIAAFAKEGVLPDMVEVGNEVDGGMIWPDGRLPKSWDNYADLVKNGIRGIEEGSKPAPRPKIMMHIAKGGDWAGTKWFFDNLNRYRVNYDIIGQSYYPWWHGSLLDLRHNLYMMATTYKKEIVVTEVAYNWRPGEYRTKPGPFPESPDGQRQFLDEVMRAVLETPNGLGKGISWWEPAVEGGLRRRGMFGDDGNALPVITVFDKWTRH